MTPNSLPLKLAELIEIKWPYKTIRSRGGIEMRQT